MQSVPCRCPACLRRQAADLPLAREVLEALPGALTASPLQCTPMPFESQEKTSLLLFSPNGGRRLAQSSNSLPLLSYRSLVFGVSAVFHLLVFGIIRRSIPQRNGLGPGKKCIISKHTQRRRRNTKEKAKAMYSILSFGTAAFLDTYYFELFLC
jgi:hypothetical protein